jgi:hypothetical protein
MFFSRQLARIEQKLDLLIERINAMSVQISANLQALMTQVAQNTSVEASAVTLIQGLIAQINSAVGSGDDAALPALTASLSQSAVALAAAVAANTPAPTASAAAAKVAAATVMPKP